MQFFFWILISIPLMVLGFIASHIMFSKICEVIAPPRNRIVFKRGRFASFVVISFLISNALKTLAPPEAIETQKMNCRQNYYAKVAVKTVGHGHMYSFLGVSAGAFVGYFSKLPYAHITAAGTGGICGLGLGLVSGIVVYHFMQEPLYQDCVKQKIVK